MPKEGHYINRSNWLRAAVLGANDGIVSISSLLVGVTSAGMATGNVALTGFAGLTAGALSMAAGEYVSVPIASSPSSPRRRWRKTRTTSWKSLPKGWRTAASMPRSPSRLPRR